MQKILIAVALILLVKFSAFSQKEIFLKQVDWKLEHISDNSYENEYFMTMKFNKGETYRFKITNHIDNYAGEAVIQILDADKLVTTNVFESKYFDSVNLVCNKTGFYDVLIRYKDNRVGHSMINVLLMQ